MAIIEFVESVEYFENEGARLSTLLRQAFVRAGLHDQFPGAQLESALGAIEKAREALFWKIVRRKLGKVAAHEAGEKLTAENEISRFFFEDKPTFDPALHRFGHIIQAAVNGALGYTEAGSYIRPGIHVYAWDRTLQFAFTLSEMIIVSREEMQSDPKFNFFVRGLAFMALTSFDVEQEVYRSTVVGGGQLSDPAHARYVAISKLGEEIRNIIQKFQTKSDGKMLFAATISSTNGNAGAFLATQDDAVEKIRERIEEYVGQRIDAYGWSNNNVTVTVVPPSSS